MRSSEKKIKDIELLEENNLVLEGTKIGPDKIWRLLKMFSMKTLPSDFTNRMKKGKNVT